MTAKLTTATFIERAQAVHGDLYNYSQTVYVNQTVKVAIECKVHGIFYQLPPNHYLRKSKCPKCSWNNTANSQRKSTITFIAEAAAVHNGFYSYSRVDYRTAKKAVTITCPEHGDFQQLPTNHLKGVGCPSCHGGPYAGSKPTLLYYLSINGGQAYKIGLTSKSINARFGPQDIHKIEVLNTWEFPTGLEAYQVEQTILKTFTDYQYTGTSLLLSGNTELFTTDIFTLLNIPLTSSVETLVKSTVNFNATNSKG